MREVPRVVEGCFQGFVGIARVTELTFLNWKDSVCTQAEFGANSPSAPGPLGAERLLARFLAHHGHWSHLVKHARSPGDRNADPKEF